MGRIRFLTSAEEDNLLVLLGQWGLTDHCDAVTVLIDTGLRVGELFRLTPRDVDQKQRLLHVWQNKADHPRSVTLTKRAYQIIKRRLHGAAYGGPDLFPYNHDWLRRPWDRAKITMGLGDDKQFVPTPCVTPAPAAWSSEACPSRWSRSGWATRRSRSPCATRTWPRPTCWLRCRHWRETHDEVRRSGSGSAGTRFGGVGA